MSAALIVLAAIVGTALALSVLALVGSVRGKQTPQHDTQPYDPEIEWAITQALAVQDQPIYMLGVIDELAKRRDGGER